MNKQKYDYEALVIEEMKKLRDQKFTGKASFIFDFRDGGISNLSLHTQRNLTKKEKPGYTET